MTNIDIVKTCLSAFKKNNDQLLPYISKHCALRKQNGQVTYSKDEVVQYLTSIGTKDPEHLTFSTEHQSVLVDIQDSPHTQMKWTFEQGKIVRIYETIVEENMTRIRCDLSYDGSSYHGYQRQPNQQTIQGVIEQALYTITKEDITIHSSGRTDRFVHAYHQVIHFDTSSKINPNTFYQVLNSYLPDSIIVHSSCEVSQTFHSRYDVVTKEYEYRIKLGDYDVTQRQYEWNPGPFDIELFTQAIHKVVGTHDFTSFTVTNKDQDKVRTIYQVNIQQKENHLFVRIEGNGFLRYMVRNIIAACMEIAKGNATYTIESLLQERNNQVLKTIANAEGLYLYRVTY